MKRAYKLAVKFLGLALIVLETMCCVNLSPNYGLVSLRNPQNAELHFKREVRGLNYDVVVLSSNKDYCKNRMLVQSLSLQATRCRCTTALKTTRSTFS